MFERAASFSHREVEYLGLDLQQGLESFKELGLNGVRLSAYWNEIESEPGKFKFEKLDHQIKFFEQANIDVILTIGMKAQRWPEFYIPQWIKAPQKKEITIQDHRELFERTLSFIEKVVNRYKERSAVKIWQVENEPMDESGEFSMKINPVFLAEEVGLVRKLDSSRKILINVWGNLLTQRDVWPHAMDLADIIGIEIYPKVPIVSLLGFTKYLGPQDSSTTIKDVGERIKKLGKEFWIVELQGEPWEKDESTKKSDNPPSFNPDLFEKNLAYAQSLNPDTVIWWGFEYWLKKKKERDVRYWDAAAEFIKGQR